MSAFLSRRIGRGPYWLLVLINSVAALVLIQVIGFVLRHLMVGANGRPDPVSYLWLMNPLALQVLHLPVFVGTIWRLHDTGHRSWPVWLLSSYAIGLTGLAYLAHPIAGAIQAAGISNISGPQAITVLYSVYGFQLVLAGVFIRTTYLCCLRGDYGPNAYGPPPGDNGNPSSPDEPAEAAQVSLPIRAPAPPPARSAPPQKRAFGRRTG